MSPGAVALSVTAIIAAAGATIGFLAGVRRHMDLEQWTVAGRGFGTALMFLLAAGEIYTTGSFLGTSGWAYSRGGPSLYFLAYITLAYVISFFLLPKIWEMGHAHRLHTQSDFFKQRYGSESLAALVSVIGVVFLIPYVQLQLTGLGIIVSTASFGMIGQTSAEVISVALVTLFVFTGGVRAVAWVSVLKDVLMVIAAVAVGIGIPYLHFGGIGNMFSALAKAHPQHLTMPGATTDLGHSWYITTVLLTTMGFYMWPQTFPAMFSARSADTLRRNAVVMPLYTITLAFIFFAGFTAVLAAPGLPNGDLSMLTVVRQSFPAWFLGLVGGAGVLTGMVPASILLLTAATLFAKNLARPVFAPSMSDARVAALARGGVIVLSVVSLVLAIFFSTSIGSLILIGYAGISQFFPGVLLGLYWKGVTASGVLCGLICGVVLAGGLMLSGHDPFLGWNAGFVALCVNMAVTLGVSLLSVKSEHREE